MDNKNELMNFLNNHKVISVATSSSSRGIWIANVYYAIDKNFNFYFMSEPNTQHSQDIEENPEVACAIAYFNPNNLSDRVGIQMTGNARKITNLIEMGKAFQTYTSKYISSKGVMTVENLKHKVIKARPYIIEPKLIKFMNDGLYGNFATKIFEFN